MNNKPSCIKIALADDQLLFRKGMISIITSCDDMEVTMEAANGRELLEQLSATASLPDILLLDLEMPEMNGVDTIKALQKSHVPIKTIVLSVHNEPTYIARMVELGACGYLQKNSEPDEVIQAIRAIHKSGFHLDERTMLAMRTGLTQPHRKIPLNAEDALTTREKEILVLICKQCTTPEIAEELFISERTVDGHRNNLLQKTGCRNIAGLVIYAIQHRHFDTSNFI